MTPSQARLFDRAVAFSQQAGACSLHGYHAESAHLWTLAAACAATDSGRQACLDNARAELVLSWRRSRMH